MLKKSPYLSESWENYNSLHPGGLSLTASLLTRSRLEGKHSSTILDFGAGKGETTAFLSTKGFHVIGLDSDTNMVSHAKKRNPDLTFSHYNGRKIPLENESVDAVFAECTLSTVSNLPSVLDELRRILKLGGLLCISDLYTRSTGTFSQSYWAHALNTSHFYIENFIDETPIFKDFIASWLWSENTLNSLSFCNQYMITDLSYFSAIFKKEA